MAATPNLPFHMRKDLLDLAVDFGWLAEKTARYSRASRSRWSSRPDRDSKASVRSRNALLSSTRCRTWLVTTPDFLTLSITWRLSFRPVGAPGHLPFSSFSCFANALLQESDVMF